MKTIHIYLEVEEIDGDMIELAEIANRIEDLIMEYDDELINKNISPEGNIYIARTEIADDVTGRMG